MIDPLSLSSGVAGLVSLALQIVQVTRQYCNDVKSASEGLQKLSEELEALIQILERLKAFLQDDDASALRFSNSSAICSSTDLCHAKLQAFHTKIKLKQQGTKISRAVKQLVWPLEKTDTNAFVDEIRGYIQIFGIALSIDGCTLLSKTAGEVSASLDLQLKTLQETKILSTAIPGVLSSIQDAEKSIARILDFMVNIDQMRLEVADIRTSIRTVEFSLKDAQNDQAKEAARSKRRDILSWISSLMFEDKQADNISRHQPQTCGWFLTDDQFQDWIRGGKSSCLWCPGVPGAGKTILISVVVEFIDSLRNRDEIYLAYIYCDYKDRTRQTVPAMLSSLIRQLLQQLPHIPHEISTLYDSKTSLKQPNNLTVKECIAILESLCDKDTYVVIDALDECPEMDNDSNSVRSTFMFAIRQISGFAQVLITSRPHIALPSFVPGCARLDVRASELDIRSYIQSRVSSYPRLRLATEKDPNLLQTMFDAICSNAQGMFLIARLHMDQLATQISARNVRNTLRSLPMGINACFDAAITRIKEQPDEYSDLALRVITWVFWAKRPLGVHELQEALSVEDGDTRLDETGIVEAELLVSVCCGLVVADEEDGIIRLVHYTLQDYLEKSDIGRNALRDRELASVCLSYLNFDEFGNLPRLNIPFPEILAYRLEKYKFLKYASCFWAEHVRNRLENDLEEAISQLLTSNTHLLNAQEIYYWIQWQSLSNSILEAIPEDWLPLHAAAFWGLKDILVRLIESGLDINAKDCKWQTPLSYACLQQHEASVRLLLERGADPCTSNYQNGGPLLVTARRGNLSIARALIEKGADINARGFRDETVLQEAVFSGESGLISLLIARGVDVNAKSRKEEEVTALQIAVCGGRKDLVRELLLAGADPRIGDRSNFSAIHWAVERRDLGTLHLLLNDSIFPDILKPASDLEKSTPQQHSQDWPYSLSTTGITPLHQAIYGAWEDGIEALIRSGADPLVPDIYGCSSLEWASLRKNLLQKLSTNNLPRDLVGDDCTRARILGNSIRRLSTKVLNEKYRWRDDLLLFGLHADPALLFLNRCLLRAPLLEEAVTCLEQRFAWQPRNRHGAGCDMCDEFIVGQRFICTTCPDTDLCKPCKEQHSTYQASSADLLEGPPTDEEEHARGFHQTKLEYAPYCINHEFLEIPGPFFSSLKPGCVNVQGESMEEWLSRLRDSFPEHSQDFSGSTVVDVVGEGSAESSKGRVTELGHVEAS